MSAVTDSLTSKVGPLPAWAWGLGLGGVIIVLRKRSAKKSSPVAAVTSDGAAAATGANSVPGAASAAGIVGNYPMPTGYQANPGGVVGPDGSQHTGTAAGPVSNFDWSNQAFDILRAQGYSVVASSEAIRKYLAGEPITPSEEGMVAIALTHLGQPPQGAPGIARANTQTTLPNDSTATPTQTSIPSPIVYQSPAYTPPAPAPVAAAPAPVYNVIQTIPAPAQGPSAALPVQAVRSNVRPNLSVGSTGQAVKAVAQWHNVVLKLGGADWLTAESTGQYDAQLASAVAALQQWVSGGQYQGSPGVIDANGWALIDRVAAETSTPVPPLN